MNVVRLSGSPYVRPSNAHAMAMVSPPGILNSRRDGIGMRYPRDGRMGMGMGVGMGEPQVQTPGESEMPELKSHFKSSLGGAAPSFDSSST